MPTVRSAALPPARCVGKRLIPLCSHCRVVSIAIDRRAPRVQHGHACCTEGCCEREPPLGER
eukprot:1973319-Prymnesium_polylepis.2